jgi:hypothetical protein
MPAMNEGERGLRYSERRNVPDWNAWFYEPKY